MKQTIRLLKLLSNRRRYSVEELQERLSVSKRTVYRYLYQIESAGMIIERTEGRYRLLLDQSDPAFYHLLHFSEEEVFLFYESLSHMDLTLNSVKRLFNKLSTLYDFNTLKDFNSSTSHKIKVLAQALRQKRQVILRLYRSSNSQYIEDRLVEPFCMNTNDQTIWCVDLKDLKIKQFKWSRCTAVELSQEPWQYESKHLLPFTDAFRMSAPAAIDRIRLQLNLKAYNLMKEEFPLSKKYLEEVGNGFYLLDIPIANYHGIGRFVLGLPGAVKVLGSVPFKEFLNNKKKLYS